MSAQFYKTVVHSFYYLQYVELRVQTYRLFQLLCTYPTVQSYTDELKQFYILEIIEGLAIVLHNCTLPGDGPVKLDTQEVPIITLLYL